jgi:1,4-alpha-glucan branching enzyme
MSMKKKYKRNNQICKVTFSVPREAFMGAKAISVVGDFNNWSIKDNPMKKLKNGEFTVELDLEANKEYQFRYLIDEKIWENDWKADKYVRSEYGNCENSVIVV